MSLLGEPLALLRAGPPGGAASLPGKRERALLRELGGASDRRFLAAFCRAVCAMLPGGSRLGAECGRQGQQRQRIHQSQPGQPDQRGQQGQQGLALYRALRSAVALCRLERPVLIATGAFLLRVSRSGRGGPRSAAPQPEPRLGPHPLRALAGLEPAGVALAALSVVAKAHGVGLSLGDFARLAGLESPGGRDPLADIELYLLQAAEFRALVNEEEYWGFCLLLAGELGCACALGAGEGEEVEEGEKGEEGQGQADGGCVPAQASPSPRPFHPDSGDALLHHAIYLT